MSTFLTESVPVSLSGALGDAGNFRLYACDQPNVILFVAKQPKLMVDAKGKQGVAITTYTSQTDGGALKITGGAATIGLNTAPQLDAESIELAKALVVRLNAGDPAKLKFLPLTTQKGRARLNLPTAAGVSDQRHNDRDVGTPGGSLSFLANLAEAGAIEWSKAVKEKTRVNGDITIEYEYLRRLPDVGATVVMHGKRIFEHLSGALNATYNGILYGGSAKIDAAWDNMTRDGAIEVQFLNTGLPPELEKLRDEMVKTFVSQATKVLFEQIFEPMPKVAPAEANGNGSGAFGGAQFALKWKKQSDAVDLSLKIEFHGTTWLTDTMDISLAALFGDLDPACLTEVPAQQAFDSVLQVDADPMLTSVSASLSYSAGHRPEAPVFTQDGGTQRYTVITTAPDNVLVSCIAHIDFSPPRWPVIPYKVSKTSMDGGRMIVIKSSQWVGRQTINLFIREGDRIVPPHELTSDDFLTLNVSVAGPHLPNVVRDAAHMNAMTPVEFAYPLDPQGRPCIAKFSAFGVIGGKLVRAPEQVIPQEDTELFILATRGGKIELVTSQTVLGESDGLAERLRQGRGRPVLSTPTVLTSEATRGGAAAGSARMVSGRTAGIEYSADGTSLLLRLTDGGSRRIGLHSLKESEPFDTVSKLVEVQLDESGRYADRILVDLSTR